MDGRSSAAALGAVMRGQTEAAPLYREVRRRPQEESNVALTVLGVLLTIVLTSLLLVVGQIAAIRSGLDGERVVAKVRETDLSRLTFIDREGTSGTVYQLAFAYLPPGVHMETGLTEAQMPAVFEEAGTLRSIALLAGRSADYLLDGEGERYVYESEMQSIFGNLTLAIERVTGTQLSAETREAMDAWYRAQGMGGVDLDEVLRAVPLLQTLRPWLSPEFLFAAVLLVLVVLIWLVLLAGGRLTRWPLYAGVGAVFAAVISLSLAFFVPALIGRLLRFERDVAALRSVAEAILGGLRQAQLRYALVIGGLGVLLILVQAVVAGLRRPR
ncbi:MAG: hypothetical protein QM296_08840 [Bacillota bacterium]|nr:hypothetical protein [Bacillota bacterium]